MIALYDKSKQRVPIKVWIDDLSSVEPDCIEQAINISNLPFIHSHVALMPDCHLGMGTPIGCVYGTKGVLVIGSVGVDIGCGMAFCQTNIPISAVTETRTKDDQPLIKFMLGSITRNVPVGFAHHKEPQDWVGFDYAPSTVVVQQQLEKARFQLGTLGGGK